MTALHDSEVVMNADPDLVVAAAVVVEAVADDIQSTRGLPRHTMLAKDGVVIRDLDLIPRVSIHTITNVTDSTLNTIIQLSKHFCNSIII